MSPQKWAWGIKMKKLLYLTTWDFSDGPSTGITNKIKAQIKAFESYEFSVDYTCILNGETIFCKNGQDIFLGKVGKFRKLAANYYLFKKLKKENYAYVYNRYGLMDTYYYKLLRMLKRKGSKIVVEIPTFPYDKERLPGLIWWFLYFLDKVYRRNLKKIVDAIATYSEDKKIFGINTIHINNGIDFEGVSLRKPESNTDEIRLLAVAGLAKWHGYDRLLEGMGKYYQTDGKRKVYFYIVGDGAVRSEYEKIVEKYQIQKYCIFKGIRTGKELDEIYNMCDIGIEGLAAFRKGVFLSSSLKSREYAAKGLPFITASKLDVFEDQNFILKVPENDTDIEIYDIISFYDCMYQNQNPQEVAEKIRNKAEKCCEIRITMKPVVKFLLEDGQKNANDL